MARLGNHAKAPYRADASAGSGEGAQVPPARAGQFLGTGQLALQHCSDCALLAISEERVTYTETSDSGTGTGDSKHLKTEFAAFFQ